MEVAAEALHIMTELLDLVALVAAALVPGTMHFPAEMALQTQGAAAVLADLTALVEQAAAVAVHLVEEAQPLVIRTPAAAAAAVGMTTAEVRANQTQVVLGL